MEVKSTPIKTIEVQIVDKPGATEDDHSKHDSSIVGDDGSDDEIKDAWDVDSEEEESKI